MMLAQMKGPMKAPSRWLRLKRMLENIFFGNNVEDDDFEKKCEDYEQQRRIEAEILPQIPMV